MTVYESVLNFKKKSEEDVKIQRKDVKIQRKTSKFKGKHLASFFSYGVELSQQLYRE